MSHDKSGIPVFLAAPLRKDPAPWPDEWRDTAAIEAVGDAAIAHGVAGLLAEGAADRRDWPPQLTELLRQQALAQAMWEMRHRQVLIRLLEEFECRGIPCLVLKGTALAYDVYGNPPTRSRGDTDLLVAPGNAAKAEAALAGLGYTAATLGGVSREFALQRTWTMALPDGNHSIDLHWQVMNAPSLAGLLPFDDCYSGARILPRLSPLARTMDRVRLLIHASLHRSMQNNAPYFVDGKAYFEPDRLIWLYDIHLLAGVLDQDEWSRLCTLTAEMGVAGPCLSGLNAAKAILGTAVPDSVAAALKEASTTDRGSSYFGRSHPLSRAREDIRAVSGLTAKFRYALSRVVTTEDFLRSKYPRLADLPLPLLYGRRLLDAVRRRSGAPER